MKRLLTALALIVLLAVPRMAGAQQQGPTLVVLTSGTSWTPPSNWNNSAYAIFAIGAGNDGNATTFGGGGAAGDITFIDQTSGITFSHATPVTIQIGSHGGGVTTTGATWLGGASCAAASVCAAGGAAPSTSTGGTAGNTANDVPSGNAHAGCAGGNGVSLKGGGGGGGAPNISASCTAGQTAPNAAIGGAGGASAEGTTLVPAGAGGTSTTNATNGGNGVNFGSTGNDPAATSVGSGSGGGGGSANASHLNGANGGTYGAGGGGAGSASGTKGNGANGVLVIAYYPIRNGKVQTHFSATCADTSLAATVSGVTAHNSLLFTTCISASGNTPVVTSIDCGCTEEDKGSGTTVYGDVGLCPNQVGGSTTCTVHFTESGTGCFEIFQLIEQPPLNHLDVSNHNTNAGTTTPTTGSITTTDGNDVLLEQLCTSNNMIPLAGPGNAMITLGSATNGGASDPVLNNANCTGNTAPWACCTGSGTGNCQFSQLSFGGISLPSALATATYNIQTNLNNSVPVAAAVMAVNLQATPSATATATATATNTATPTPGSTPSAFGGSAGFGGWLGGRSGFGGNLGPP